MNRREFLRGTAAAIGAGLAYGGQGPAFGQSMAGKPVETRKIITSTAQFDPARPEIAKLVAEAAKTIGWEVEPNPIDYNEGVQRVIMEHDYDMYLLTLAGSPIRIDPNIFIHGMHHSGEYRRGGFNWMGYKSDRVDALATAQAQTMDLEARRAPVYEAQQLIFDDQPGSVLAYPQITQAHRSDKLKGLVPMLGEGIGGFWSDINMEVIGGDGYSRTGINVDLKHLNPLAVTDVLNFMDVGSIYDTLFRVAPDGKPQPWAATALAFADDRTLDVTIRPGMKWHDGTDFTVEDVKFSFDYQKTWKAPFFLAALENVEAVEVLDGSTVRIRLATPAASFIPIVLAGMFMIPKHIWEHMTDTADVDDPLKLPNDNPIGSGPFKFDHWRRGSEYKVSAFREHFNPPKCAGIIRVLYGSHDATAAAIEKGDCDRSRYILSPTLVDALKNVPNVVARGYPSHAFYHLGYHNRVAPFTDPAFRRVLNLIMPRQLTSELVLIGYAEPGASVISPSNAYWHNDAVKPPAEDAEKARALLAEAGYSWDAQGRLCYPQA
ncbi:MAG: ABC transporter substrate-binding protein [Dongiaceae bacterium]